MSSLGSSSNPWETNYRIPDNTIPLHYDVYLFPNLENQTFSGKVSILIKTTEPRDFFVSHIQYLEVTKTELKNSDQEIVPLEEAFEYESNQFWVVVPSKVPIIYFFDGRSPSRLKHSFFI